MLFAMGPFLLYRINKIKKRAKEFDSPALKPININHNAFLSAYGARAQ